MKEQEHESLTHEIGILKQELDKIIPSIEIPDIKNREKD